MKNIIMKEKIKKSVDSLSRHLKALHDFEHLDKKDHAPGKLTIDIKNLHLLFYGDVDKTPNPDNAQKLVKKLLDSKDNLFLKLAQNMKYLQFEAKKQNADILNFIIRRCSRNKCHVYIQCKTDRNGYNPIIQSLLDEFRFISSFFFFVVFQKVQTNQTN